MTGDEETKAKRGPEMTEAETEAVEAVGQDRDAKWTANEDKKAEAKATQRHLLSILICD